MQTQSLADKEIKERLTISLGLRGSSTTHCRKTTAWWAATREEEEKSEEREREMEGTSV